MEKVLNLLFSKFFVFAFLAVLNINLYSQNWMEVGGGISGPSAEINCFYTDSISHILYIGGGFNMAGNINANAIAKWDGLQWLNLGNGTSSYKVLSITKYRNDIIATSTGDFFSLNSFKLNCIAKWDGVNWDSLRGGINPSGTALSVINDTLYVGGTFEYADTVNTRLLAKWDGNGWHGFHFTTEDGNRLYSIFQYNSNIYLGGRFWDTLNPSIVDFCLLQGNQLFQVGALPMAPAGFAVMKMIIYNNELYISGYINSSCGNNILKYDGTNFISVGGADDGVSDMVVFNNELYVVGVFEHIGGVAAKYIARWDGSNWNSVCTDTFNNYIHNVAVLDNELYIGGGFTEINGQSVKRVAKYIGPLSINENETKIIVSVFPNPASDKIQIHSNKFIKRLKLINIYGELCISTEINNNSACIDLSSLGNGVYVLEMSTLGKNIIRRIIKN